MNITIVIKLIKNMMKDINFQIKTIISRKGENHIAKANLDSYKIQVFLPSLTRLYKITRNQNKFIEQYAKIINHEYLHLIIHENTQIKCEKAHHKITKLMGLNGKALYDCNIFRKLWHEILIRI